jgi:gliding motility-associated-like protein
MEPTSNFSAKRVVLVIILSILSTSSFGQYCDSITPTMNVDLSSSPNMNWTSPVIARNGNCCGTSAPDKCLEFVITLNPAANAVSFNIASGAVPPGALFYQIDCGPVTPVGSPICLTGPGPHHLTFCKPGNNSNTFSITSYSQPIIGPDITLNSGCSGMIYANYYNEPSMTWTSISPGPAGAYDSYLDCTSGCDTVNVSAPNNPPAFVDYLVCGTDIGGCNPLPFCDTIRVTFVDPVTVSVSPNTQHLCFGAPNILISATASGGTAPYNYVWSTGEVTSSITVGAGTYWVNVTDASGCLIASDTAVITQDALPIVANAGPDQIFCQQTVNNVNLNGSVQTATGGIWSNGAGSFAPSNTALNAVYTPTAGEIASGSVELILTTTGNNGCPGDQDTVQIQFAPFNSAINLTTINVSCNGSNDGEAYVTANGTFGPYQYSWDNGIQTTDTFALNLAPGVHELQIINSLGCDTTIFFTITEPVILTANLSAQTNNICFGEQTGTATVSVAGGTAPYNYSWNTAPFQSSATANNLPAGNYTCAVTDQNGCAVNINVTITEPAQLNLGFAEVEPNCFAASNGSISSLVGGGTAPYSYDWSTGAESVNIYNLVSGPYSLDVEDANGCTVSASTFLGQPSQLTGSISPSSVVCPNAQVTLGVSVNGGTGNYQFDWAPNGQATDTITEIVAADQVYSCTITDNNGCSILLSTTVMIILMNPSDVIASIDDDQICLGDPVGLTASFVGNDPTVSMQWQNCPICPTNTTIILYPSANTSYILSATNSCGQTIKDTVSVDVNQPPVIDLPILMASICPGGSVSFINGSANSASWDYSWNFGDGTTSSQMNPSHTFNTQGTYEISLTITDDNGCSSSLIEGSQVIVNPQANAVFTSSSLEETTLDPTFELSNFSMNSSFYSWDFGDGTGSNNVNPVHTYEGPGAYQITLTANNMYNCPDSTLITVIVKPSYSIFVPNAFTPDNDDHNGIFFVKGYGISEEGFTLYIFNRWGDLIFESHDMDLGWDGVIKKDGTVAQDGVYTWVVVFKDVTDISHRMEGHVSLLR